MTVGSGGNPRGEDDSPAGILKGGGGSATRDERAGWVDSPFRSIAASDVPMVEVVDGAAEEGGGGGGGGGERDTRGVSSEPTRPSPSPRSPRLGSPILADGARGGGDGREDTGEDKDVFRFPRGIPTTTRAEGVGDDGAVHDARPRAASPFRPPHDHEGYEAEKGPPSPAPPPTGEAARMARAGADFVPSFSFSVLGVEVGKGKGIASASSSSSSCVGMRRVERRLPRRTPAMGCRSPPPLLPPPHPLWASPSDRDHSELGGLGNSTAPPAPSVGSSGPRSGDPLPMVEENDPPGHRRGGLPPRHPSGND